MEITDDKFEQALDVAPGDFDLRLVYSDWLEDNGNLTAAEYHRWVAKSGIVPHRLLNGTWGFDALKLPVCLRYCFSNRNNRPAFTLGSRSDIERILATIYKMADGIPTYFLGGTWDGRICIAGPQRTVLSVRLSPPVLDASVIRGAITTKVDANLLRSLARQHHDRYTFHRFMDPPSEYNLACTDLCPDLIPEVALTALRSDWWTGSQGHIAYYP